VHHLQKVYDVGERRACKATGFHRSSQRYKSRSDPQTELRIRLKDLAASRVRYGYRRLHIATILRGESDDRAGQRIFVSSGKGRIALRAPWLIDNPAGTAFREPVFRPDSLDSLRARRIPSANDNNFAAISQPLGTQPQASCPATSAPQSGAVKRRFVPR
jgi:transposase InsO family protein